MRGGARFHVTLAGGTLAAACAVCTGPAAAAAPAEAEALHRPGVESHFAFVDRRAVVRAQPSQTASPLTRLRLRTGDQTDELVLVLARAQDDAGSTWLMVRFPTRPPSRAGWVPRRAVGELRRVSTLLQVDTRSLKATLVRRGRVVFRARVAVGTSYWPTPRGEFYVRSRMSGFGRGTVYGPLAFGTSAMSGVLTDWPGGGFVGIHGTNQPWLIPGRVSHGCIRMRNEDILRLAKLMPVGTPLTIR